MMRFTCVLLCGTDCPGQPEDREQAGTLLLGGYYWSVNMRPYETRFTCILGEETYCVCRVSVGGGVMACKIAAHESSQIDSVICDLLSREPSLTRC